MQNLFSQLIHDEAGFIVSAELVLVATIAVLSMVVGLSEVANAINQELNDVANAFGAINQSFSYQGMQGCNGNNSAGSSYNDCVDSCDMNSIVGSGAQGEGNGSGMGY